MTSSPRSPESMFNGSREGLIDYYALHEVRVLTYKLLALPYKDTNLLHTTVSKCLLTSYSEGLCSSLGVSVAVAVAMTSIAYLAFDKISSDKNFHVIKHFRETKK